MAKVLNKYKDLIHKDAIYIGRPSKWGNPFLLKDFKTREECVEAYKKWVYTQPNLIKQIKNELKDKDLVCFCAPKMCHGDVLLEIANGAN